MARRIGRPRRGCRVSKSDHNSWRIIGGGVPLRGVWAALYERRYNQPFSNLLGLHSGCEDVVDHLGAGGGEIGQGFFTAVVLIGEFAVVDPELLQDGGMQVWNTHPVFHRAIPEVVGCPVNVPGFKAAAGHPQAERVPVMIASPCRSARRQPAELAGPHDDRRRRAAHDSFRSLIRRSDRQFGLSADLPELFVNVGVDVPGLYRRLDGREHLHEAHARLRSGGGPSGSACHSRRWRAVQPVELLGGLCLFREVQHSARRVSCMRAASS